MIALASRSGLLFEDLVSRMHMIDAMHMIDTEIAAKESLHLNQLSQ